MAMPLRPIRPSHQQIQSLSHQLRQFSISAPCSATHLAKIPLHKSEVPEYPYGKAQWYKQSDTGLYGGLRISSGNNVSKKTETKTRRKWRPNIQIKRLYSHALQGWVRVKVATRVLRTIDKCGGLDEYLIGEKPARVKELGLKGWELRCQVMATEWWQQRRQQDRQLLGMTPMPLRKYVPQETEDGKILGMNGELLSVERSAAKSAARSVVKEKTITKQDLRFGYGEEPEAQSEEEQVAAQAEFADNEDFEYKIEPRPRERFTDLKTLHVVEAPRKYVSARMKRRAESLRHRNMTHWPSGLPRITKQDYELVNNMKNQGLSVPLPLRIKFAEYRYLRPTIHRMAREGRSIKERQQTVRLLKNRELWKNRLQRMVSGPPPEESLADRFLGAEDTPESELKRKTKPKPKSPPQPKAKAKPQPESEPEPVLKPVAKVKAKKIPSTLSLLRRRAYQWRENVQYKSLGPLGSKHASM